jgi:hypothetical protein
MAAHEYDTLMRLRKISLPAIPLHLPFPFQEKCRVYAYGKNCLRCVIRLSPALLGSAIEEDQSAASSPLSPLLSCASSVGTPATYSRSISHDRASSGTGKYALDSALSLPLSGRLRPVLLAKLACLFSRRRKIQCRSVASDKQDHTCQ